jgi:hypothetical protein
VAKNRRLTGVSLKKGKELSILTKNLGNDVILICGGNEQ